MKLLLLHAFPLDERMWEPQRAAFGDVVAPRLYGRGSSMEGWARSVLAEVDGEPLAVGAPMGGTDAVAVARGLTLGRRPDELVGAVEAIRDRRDSSEVVGGFERPVLFV